MQKKNRDLRRSLQKNFFLKQLFISQWGAFPTANKLKKQRLRSSSKLSRFEKPPQLGILPLQTPFFLDFFVFLTPENHSHSFPHCNLHQVARGIPVQPRRIVLSLSIFVKQQIIFMPYLQLL
jgi:hypothetical protein